MQEAEEMTVFVEHVLDSIQANVVMCDADLKIVAINASAWKTLRRWSAEFRAAFGSDVDQLIGMPIQRFLRDPLRLEAILGDPSLLPHSAEFAVGSAIFELRFDALRTPQGEISGYAVVAEDVTHRHAAEGERDVLLRERAVLLSEVRHRVNECLRTVSSLARIEGADGPALTARLTSIARVHEKIYAHGDVSRVNLDDYVRGLVGELVAVHSAPGSNIKIETAAHAEIRDLDRLAAFGLVLSELVVNAVRHGFAGGRSGRLRVTARDLDGGVEVVVSDDGAGLPEGAPSRAGLGLKFACALIERRLKGELKLVSRGGGMACVFTLPAFSARPAPALPDAVAR